MDAQHPHYLFFQNPIFQSNSTKSGEKLDCMGEYAICVARHLRI